MRKFIVVMALGAFLAFVPGCRTVSDQAATQIGVETAAVQADLREWDKLSDDQKKHSTWARGRAFADLDFSVNGKPIPDLFKADPWKPVTPPAPAPAPGPGK